MPDLAALEVLLAVANRGSLNAAASEVGVSQQAVSARLRAIEAQVGVPLLIRGARGSRLSPAGEAVVQWASRVLDAAADMDAGISALRTTTRAQLSIAASLTVAEHLLPGWLVSLRAQQQAAPTTLTEIALVATNTATVLEHVHDGLSDLGFIEGPEAPGGLQSRTVAVDRLVVVVPPGHAWTSRRRPLTSQQLASTPMVTREAGSGTRTAFETALRTALGEQGRGSDPAPPVLALASAAAVRAAVSAGAGPAVMSALAVTDDIAAGRLVPVPVSAALDLRRQLRAVWRGAAQPPAGPVRDLIAIAEAGRHYGESRRRSGM